MRLHLGRLAVAFLLVLVGCARYQPEPLSLRHPAHPDAPATPEPPRSATLSATLADAPSAPPAALAAAAPGPGAPASTVVGEGEVVKTVPGASQIVVDHGDIPGFMEAMTMGYRVEPASLLAGVKEGDRVRFTIDVGRRAIIRLDRLP